ncbi:hypothetical protein COS86_00210 [Candidatus Bathyarchaeota archaeon CG07_land_8_20_14_0_80_47_9]|jgi:hypothetical protein|nr:MAG: hypothetical protein COS86_00210 [Candidatus Bathyarchaeota archaeon CG07_land_8_20_14_0_80_47_9]
MNAADERSSTHEIKILRDLYEEMGSEEKIIRSIKVGLLSLRATSLERENADLIKRTGDLEKYIAELPHEIARFQQLLEKALKDRKTLEKLLDKKR